MQILCVLQNLVPDALSGLIPPISGISVSLKLKHCLKLSNSFNSMHFWVIFHNHSTPAIEAHQYP